MESASKITWFVLLTSPGKDPVGLCATWNQTASVTTLTETQGNVSWIIPLQETERKIWRPILIIYTLELRYKLSVYLWEISCESSHPLRKYCSLRPSSPFEDIVKNRPTRGTRENTRKRPLAASPLARPNRRACSQARTIDGYLFSFHVPERLWE